MNDYLEKERKDNKLLLVYFEGTDCGACDVIKGKLETITHELREVKFLVIDAINEPELAASFNVFSVPLAILFVDGKESTRFGRNIDLINFKHDLERIINLMN